MEEEWELKQRIEEEAEKLLGNVLHRIFVDEKSMGPILNVDSVAEIIDPNPSHRMPHYAERGIPFISTIDFDGSETIRKNTANYVTEETYKEQQSLCSFAMGDILYSRIGTIGQA